MTHIQIDFTPLTPEEFDGLFTGTPEDGLYMARINHVYGAALVVDGLLTAGEFADRGAALAFLDHWSNILRSSGE